MHYASLFVIVSALASFGACAPGAALQARQFLEPQGCSPEQAEVITNARFTCIEYAEKAAQVARSNNPADRKLFQQVFSDRPDEAARNKVATFFENAAKECQSPSRFQIYCTARPEDSISCRNNPAAATMYKNDESNPPQNPDNNPWGLIGDVITFCPRFYERSARPRNPNANKCPMELIQGTILIHELSHAMLVTTDNRIGHATSDGRVAVDTTWQADSYNTFAYQAVHRCFEKGN